MTGVSPGARESSLLTPDILPPSAGSPGQSAARRPVRGRPTGALAEVDDVAGGDGVLFPVGGDDEQAAVVADAGGVPGADGAAGELHADVLANSGAEVVVLGEQAAALRVGVGAEPLIPLAERPQDRGEHGLPG